MNQRRWLAVCLLIIGIAGVNCRLYDHPPINDESTIDTVMEIIEPYDDPRRDSSGRDSRAGEINRGSFLRTKRHMIEPKIQAGMRKELKEAREQIRVRQLSRQLNERYGHLGPVGDDIFRAFAARRNAVTNNRNVNNQ